MKLPIRAHHLKAMAQSPMHCRAALLGEESAPTASMDRGTAVHCMVTGSRRVVARPAGMKKPTAAQRNAKKSSPASLVAIEPPVAKLLQSLRFATKSELEGSRNSLIDRLVLADGGAYGP